MSFDINAKVKMRESNIEILRIAVILGVIILHYNGENGGGLEYIYPNSLNEIILVALESIFICAVDLFILITGCFF